MKRLLIIYHTQSGSTRALAQAVYTGASAAEQIESRLLRAMDAGLDDLLWCDGVLFGTPENLGYMSGGLKDFFDRTFYPAAAHQLNLPYALFISAGNDGSGAVRHLERILQGYPMRASAAPLIVRGVPDAAALLRCEELGLGFATGLALGIY